MPKVSLDSDGCRIVLPRADKSLCLCLYIKQIMNSCLAAELLYRLAPVATGDRFLGSLWIPEAMDKRESVLSIGLSPFPAPKPENFLVIQGKNKGR